MKRADVEDPGTPMLASTSTLKRRNKKIPGSKNYAQKSKEMHSAWRNAVRGEDTLRGEVTLRGEDTHSEYQSVVGAPTF